MNGVKRPGEEAPPPDLQVGREYRTELVHLQHNTFEGHEQAVNELLVLALQRNERLSLGDARKQLWSAGALFTALLTKFRKSPTALHHLALLEALADIVYWSVQCYSNEHHEPGLHLVGQCFAEPANVRLSQAYAAALAKYRLPRSASQEEVYAAIRAALQ